MSRFVVSVVVVVAIQADGARGLRPEQVKEGGVIHHSFRVAGTAHMAVKAEHGLRGSHDQMQVVGYQEHATTAPIPNSCDQVVKVGLAGYVDTGRRFVKRQQFGIADQGSGQQDTAHFAA